VIQDLADMVGRRVSGVVVKESAKEPHRQVFLLFDDGTQFELYGSVEATAIKPGDFASVAGYMAGSHRPIVFAALEQVGRARPPEPKNPVSAAGVSEAALKFLDFATAQAERHYKDRASVLKKNGRQDLAHDLKLEGHTWERARTALANLLEGRTPDSVPERYSEHH
jgi:hypothetical protein